MNLDQLKVKINTLWWGLAFGLLFPAFLFFCYWLFAHSYMNFPQAFIRYLMSGHLLGNVMKLCVAANLLLFYVLLNRKMNDACKGVIAATLAYLVLTIYVVFFIEP